MQLDWVPDFGAHTLKCPFPGLESKLQPIDALPLPPEHSSGSHLP